MDRCDAEPSNVDAQRAPGQLLRPPLARLGERHRLRLVDRIGNEALGVKSVHRVPVERFPRPAVIVPSEVEKRQDSLVYAIGVDILHAAPACKTSPNRRHSTTRNVCAADLLGSRVVRRLFRQPFWVVGRAKALDIAGSPWGRALCRSPFWSNLEERGA